MRSATVGETFTKIAQQLDKFYIALIGPKGISTI